MNMSQNLCNLIFTQLDEIWRQPQPFSKWKTTSIFLIFQNGRRPQFFKFFKMEDDLNFFKGKMISFFQNGR